MLGRDILDVARKNQPCDTIETRSRERAWWPRILAVDVENVFGRR
jgi:hypothetical protein